MNNLSTTFIKIIYKNQDEVNTLRHHKAMIIISDFSQKPLSFGINKVNIEINEKYFENNTNPIIIVDGFITPKQYLQLTDLDYNVYINQFEKPKKISVGQIFYIDYLGYFAIIKISEHNSEKYAEGLISSFDTRPDKVFEYYKIKESELINDSEIEYVCYIESINKLFYQT